MTRKWNFLFVISLIVLIAGIGMALWSVFGLTSALPDEPEATRDTTSAAERITLTLPEMAVADWQPPPRALQRKSARVSA
ncbi:MAG: hypothetical protein FWH26_10755, partial [Oscillospiraceae bacterium]|nr:hypothetical protein [Oscillospiraceae bacterium]